MSITDAIPFYELQARIDPDSGSVDVHLAITAPVHFLEDGILSFLFSSDADVSSLSGEYLAGYSIEEAGPGVSIYNITFENRSGSTVTIDMVYSLVIPDDHEVNRITKYWIELNIDSMWHPFFTSFTRFHYRLNADLDENYHILGGDRIIHVPGNPRTRIIESKIPRLDISLSASKELYNRKGEYSVVYSTRKSADLDSLLQFSDQALTFLYDYIDRPEDFTQKRIVVESPRKAVGYARENYVILSKLDGMDPVYLAGFLVHEFSHYWFSTAHPESPDHWLNESFAEFLAMIYIRDTHGISAYMDEVNNKLERIKNDPKSLASYQGRPSHTAMYYTGPVVLHHFEEYVGRDRFRSLIHQMISSGISTNEELNFLIRNHLGTEAEEKLIELRSTQFSGHVVFYPEQDMTVVMLTNTRSGASRFTEQYITQLIETQPGTTIQ